MSQENVEFVHEVREAFNREDVRKLAEMSHDDLEFVSVFTAIDSGGATYRGPESWANYFEAIHDAWAEWQIEDFRALDVGDDRVVSLFRLIGTGRQSGVPVEREAGLAYWLRDGKMWRVRSYLNQSEALAAVGQSE